MTDVDFSEVHLKVIHRQKLPSQPTAIARLLTEWGLATMTQECVWVIAMDANGNIRTVVEVARGGHSEVDIHIPSVMTAVLSAGATVFTLAHNHPTGNPLPSIDDQDLTHKIMEAANACGLVFEEHIIVEPSGGSFSFVEHKLLVPAPRGGGKPLDIKRAASGGSR
jgi:DNA repair protein RadC